MIASTPPLTGNLPKLPDVPGTYILCLRLDRSHELHIGRLGKNFFHAGNYAYVGSACGPGGLRARLSRHVYGSNHPHWHIDTLRSASDVIGICYAMKSMDDTLSQKIESAHVAISEIRLECQWCQTIAKIHGVIVPVRGFGASDCRSGCQAHLFSVPDNLTPIQISKILSGKSHKSIRWLC